MVLHASSDLEFVEYLIDVLSLYLIKDWFLYPGVLVCCAFLSYL